MMKLAPGDRVFHLPRLRFNRTRQAMGRSRVHACVSATILAVYPETRSVDVLWDDGLLRLSIPASVFRRIFRLAPAQVMLRPGTLVEATAELHLYRGLGIARFDNCMEQNSLGTVVAVVNISDKVWAFIVGDGFMGWLTVLRTSDRGFSAYVRVVTP